MNVSSDLKGVQIAAVAATPLYLLSAIRHRRVSMRGFARTNWTMPLFGAALGAAFGWVESVQVPSLTLVGRVAALRADQHRMRRDDFHLIGSVVGALLLPALFLRRVGLINGLLGGAGFGGAIGVASFYGRRWSEGDLKLPFDLPKASL